jgi:hypothetical protein
MGGRKLKSEENQRMKKVSTDIGGSAMFIQLIIMDCNRKLVCAGNSGLALVGCRIS